MIILRDKRFASTKESRKKSKEANKNDKVRRALGLAQLGTALAGADSLIAGHFLKRNAEEMKEKVEENLKNKKPTDIKFIKDMQRTGKSAKVMNKASLGLIGASAALGATKLIRDNKNKKKKEK